MPITPGMTAGALHDALMPVGAALMARALGLLEQGALTFTPQPEDGVVYAHKITNDEARIDWSRPARRSPTTSTDCRPSRGRSSRPISARVRSG